MAISESVRAVAPVTTRHPHRAPTLGAAYRLGRLQFTLGGTGAAVDYLTSELASLRVDAPSDESPPITFEFVDALEPPASYCGLPPILVSEGSYRVAYNGLDYRVADDGGSVCVSVALPTPGWRRRIAPEWLLRAHNWNFLSTGEIHAKNFMYNVFDHLTHVAQVALGQSYLHASGVERDGEGIALVAWGGIGKTSSALRLITDHGYRFLSDDLALVTDDGTLWRTPKRLQVYAYNLEGDARLREMLLDGRSIIDRASWAWWYRRRGRKGVRRRVSAEELLGPQAVARNARLSRVYCLERGDGRDFAIRAITTRELATRAAQVLMHEIQPFTEFSRAMHSGSATPVLPTPEQLCDDTRQVLLRAFRDVPAWSVRIPNAATPRDLTCALLRWFDDGRTTARTACGGR